MEPTILTACILFTLLLLFLDYRQTLDIKNHEGFYEINVILGRHPSDTKITIYFIICALIAALVPYYLITNLTYQIAWFVFWAGMEIWALQNNIRLGLKI